MPCELFEEPYFEPIERRYDFSCYLAQGGAQQVTNRTHDTRYGERDETLVINLRAPRDTLEGTLECQWRSGRPIGDEVHRGATGAPPTKGPIVHAWNDRFKSKRNLDKGQPIRRSDGSAVSRVGPPPFNRASARR